MSDKEYQRRKLIYYVMKKAWKITSEVGIGIGQALEISWASIRCIVPIKHTSIRGLSYGNSQRILGMVIQNKVKYFIQCKREPYNVHDPNAIAVYLVTGIGLGSKYKIGYLSRQRASVHSIEMDAGKRLIVISSEITGQNYLENGGLLGMNIQFVII